MKYTGVFWHIQTLLLGAVHVRKTIPSWQKNVFNEIWLYSKYTFDQENVSVHMDLKFPRPTEISSIAS